MANHLPETEITAGTRLTHCSRLTPNFQIGKEYRIEEVSYSGHTYAVYDEQGELAGIGSGYFCSAEEYNQLTADDIDARDQAILAGQEEARIYLERQWQAIWEEEQGERQWAKENKDRVEKAERGEIPEYPVNNINDVFKMLDEQKPNKKDLET